MDEVMNETEEVAAEKSGRYPWGESDDNSETYAEEGNSNLPAIGVGIAIGAIGVVGVRKLVKEGKKIVSKIGTKVAEAKEKKANESDREDVIDVELVD